jgi:2-keto-3-deoxy-6-phosphogluconate aldolase
VESLRPWYRAGAPAVGIGSKLLPKPLIQAKDFDGLHELIDATVAAVAEARS